MTKHIVTKLETSFFDTTPLGVYQTRPDGTIIAANGAFIRMLGTTKRKLSTINLNNYPLGAMYSREDFKKNLESHHEIVGLEYKWKKKNGDVMYVRENAHVVRDRKKVLYYEGTVEDITDRKKVEQQLVESQTKLQLAQDKLTFLDNLTRRLAKSMDYKTRVKILAKTIVPQLADWCVIEILEEGVLKNIAIALANRQKFPIAKKLRTEFPPDPAITDGLWEVIKTGKPLFLPYIPTNMLREKAKNDRHFQLLNEMGLHSFIAIPLIARGNTIGVITLAHLDSKRTFTHTDFLFAQHITQRTATLVDNARLYTLSLEEERRRDHFLGIASHELKNILAGIKSYTQLMERKLKDDEKSADYLNRIDTNTNRMKRLIDDLIDLTKLRAQRLTLMYNTFEINQLAKEVAEEMKLIAKTHTIKMHQSEPIFVIADRMRIRQVLTNLLKNAIKYSPDAQQVILTIQTTPHTIKISIQDFGVGIDKKDQRKIFNLFYRIEKEESRTNGLGVGLYISNEIVKLHGGTITLKSTFGKGSIFSFTLPLYKKEVSHES